MQYSIEQFSKANEFSKFSWNFFSKFICEKQKYLKFLELKWITSSKFRNVKYCLMIYYRLMVIGSNWFTVSLLFEVPVYNRFNTVFISKVMNIGSCISHKNYHHSLNNQSISLFWTFFAENAPKCSKMEPACGWDSN